MFAYEYIGGNKMKSKFVGITMGDPAGIGPEISLKAIDAKKEYQQSVLIYGSYDVLRYYHQQLHLTDAAG